MSLTLELPPEKEAVLRAVAQAQGISSEQWVQDLVEERLENASQEDQTLLSGEPFWKTFTRRMHALPNEVFERLPTDGASEHDHYLYGSAKKQP